MPDSRIALIPVFCLAFLVATSVNAQTVTLGDGLLVDIDSATAFVMLPKGGLAALDVNDGKKHWQSIAADQPLALNQQQLLARSGNALRGELVLVSLNASSGDVVASSQVELTADVQAHIDDTLHEQFQLRAADPDLGETLVWQFKRRLVQGTAPNPEHEGTPDHNRVQHTGRLTVDPQTAEASISALPAETILDDRRAHVSEALPTIDGRRFLSQDNQHVLAVTNTQNDDWLKYTWRVFDIHGEPVGSMRHFVAFTPFVVVDGVLLTTYPPHVNLDQDATHGLRLVAYDLSSGAVVWAADIRDTRYRGPFPP